MRALSRLHTFLPLLALCAQASAGDKLRVAATLPSLADLARVVGGEEVEVATLLRGSVDPHLVDPRRDVSRGLARLDLLIRAGAGLEDGWLAPAVKASGNERIRAGGPGDLDASAGVKLLEARPEDKLVYDTHPVANPHYLLHPGNGSKVAKAIADRLGKLRPEQAERFRKRGENLAAFLAERMESWEGALGGLKGKAFVSYHPTWAYFGEWLGMVDAGTVEPRPGVPPTPDHLLTLVGRMDEKDVGLILVEPYHPRTVIEQVARDTGARLLTLPAEVEGVDGVKSYDGLFDEIVKRFK